MVKEQTKDIARVEMYMLYLPVDVASLEEPEVSRLNTRITGTGRYIFSLVKDDHYNRQWSR